MNPKKFYDLLINSFDFVPTQDQIISIRKLTEFLSDDKNGKVFLLKGYAGTGKTSLVKVLIKNLMLKNLNYCLLAPTGRAAKVLSNYTKKNASTIHRLIYYSKVEKSGAFKSVLKKNKKNRTLFIVDESSMISDSSNSKDLFNNNSLIKDVLEYVNFENQSKLIFIGDNAQLPPVNQKNSPALNSNFFLEQHNLEVLEYELKEVVRQSKESGILQNATILRNAISNNKLNFSFKKFDDIIKLNDGFEIQESIESTFSEYGLDNSIIIVRSNKRANQYNQQIRKTILSHDHKLTVGDRLMITKNNYFWTKLDNDIPFLANGDTIEILEIYNFKEIYSFEFAEVKIKLTDYPDAKTFDLILILNSLTSDTPSLTFEQTNKLYQEIQKDYTNIKSNYKKFVKTKENPFFNALNVKFSYCITCHKSQGGQWKIVFIEKPFLKDGIDMDYLRWLYTAVTRAEIKLYLIGF
tara:strand:+ start:18091 stop:19485 length:1395 start_codon:yes stop_codon:yes gene_type:complete